MVKKSATKPYVNDRPDFLGFNWALTDSFQRAAAVVIATRVDSNISVNFHSDNNSCELSDEINYRTHSNHKYYDSFSSF